MGLFFNKKPKVVINVVVQQEPVEPPKKPKKPKIENTENTENKKASPVLGAVVLIILLLEGLNSCVTSCSIKNPTYSPYDSSEYYGMSLDVVVSDLENAGFTNIEQLSTKSYWGTHIGEVKNVTIDGESKYTTKKKFENDVSVVVTYFAE